MQEADLVLSIGYRCTKDECELAVNYEGTWFKRTTVNDWRRPAYVTREKSVISL